MSGVNEGKSDCPLPLVNRGTFDSLMHDTTEGSFKEFLEAAEDRLKAENYDLYAIMGFFAAHAGWGEDETTAARHAMSLTYEVLRRQAEADQLNSSLPLDGTGQ